MSIEVVVLLFQNSNIVRLKIRYRRKYTWWYTGTTANGNDLSRNNCAFDDEKVAQPAIINLYPVPFWIPVT